MRGNTEANRRWLGRGLVLATALLIAVPAAPQNAEGGADELNIGYFVPLGFPPGVAGAIQREVERIIAPFLPVNSIDGTTLSNSQSVPRGVVLAVIVRDHIPDKWSLPAHTLGFCPDRGSRPRNVYVFVRPIERELGVAAAGIGGMRAADAGRAIGRVAAHEIVHAFATFAGEDRHRGNRLMAGTLDAEALLRPRLALDDRSAKALVRGLARARAGG